MLTIRKKICRVKGDKIDIQMTFRALGSDGLMFWVSEEESSMTSTSDYLALGLWNGTLQFSFNLGDGEVVIRHYKRGLADHEWHKLRATR